MAIRRPLVVVSGETQELPAADTLSEIGYAAINVITTRSWDADTITLAELADALGTLINDLKATSVLGGLPPPAVPILTAPLGGSSFYLGQSTTVSATSTDGDLTRIDFVLDPGGGETVVATDSTAPYSTGWTVSLGTALGAHTIVARAVRGVLSTDSAPAAITITPALFMDGLPSNLLRKTLFDGAAIEVGFIPVVS